MYNRILILEESVHCSKRNDPYCLGRCVDGFCQNCYNSYTDPDTGKCIPVSSLIEGCYLYSDTNTCKQCDIGYFTVVDGICVKNYIKFCLVQKNYQECSLCESGLSNSNCVSTSPCKIDNCLSCYRRETNINTINSQTGIHNLYESSESNL